MDTFKTARDAAFALRPDQPVYCFRPAVLSADALAFKSAFPGKTAYAVKTNGEPMVLETLAKAGIDCFDVASPAEFAAVRAVAPKAELLYTHPVKAQSDIRLALETYGIRVLALDHEDEVAKILRAVHGLDLDPEEITLLVRLAVRGHAAYELSKKFGAAPGHAVELVQRIARIGFRVGLCFHVGSQVEDTDTYERALASAAWVRSRSGAPIALLDIGGGFPAPYGHDPRQKAPAHPDTAALIAEVVEEAREWGFDDVPMVAEPGRVIVGAMLLADRPRAPQERAGDSTSTTESGRRCRIRGRARSRCRRGCCPIRRGGDATAIRTRWCRSRCAGPPAIWSTSCRDRSFCRRRSTPATGSRSVISAPTRWRSGPASTASIRTPSSR